MCIVRAHTPQGVLKYSAVISIMLFHSADKMQVVACGVIKVMTLCKEPIKVRTSPPSATHVRAYMLVIDGELSGAQHPTPDREGNPKQSLSDHHLGGSTLCQLQANLGDLWMMSCDSLWRIATRRSLSGNLMNPQGYTTNPLGKSSGKWRSQCA